MANILVRLVLVSSLTLVSSCATKEEIPPVASTPIPSSTTAETPPAPTPPPADVLPAGALEKSPAPFEGSGWESMFDGRTLAGWKQTDFAGTGQVECRQEVIILNMGDPFTGINYTREFPKMNYEIALDAMRVMGTDFFCGLTVPVGDSFCSLIVGGWGGSLLGISSFEGMDA